jgi:quercetin dioxygenase-like cupin family protein
VAAGICEMEVDGHGVYQLGPGETLYYGAHLKHRWRQVSTGAIRMLLIQDNVERYQNGHNAHAEPESVMSHME